MTASDRRVITMSDIELGAGGPTDEFPHDAWLARLIHERVARWSGPVDLVYNGDTLDFLRVSWRGRWPRHVTARVALDKLDAIAAAHPLFFQATAQVLALNPRNRVVFVVGNHDQELLFPQVQAALRDRLGHADRVLFPGNAYRVGDVHIEHGQQTDVMFANDPAQPFLDYEGEAILNLPWGTVALIDVAMPLQPLLYPFDRLRPRMRPLDLMPEAKELLLGRYWRYWTHDYLLGLWRGEDPLNRLNWTMFREIVHRFTSASTEVSTGDQWQEALRESDDVRLIILGHEHRTQWWTEGDNKLLRDGCLRDEYLLRADGRVGQRLPKVWAEATLRHGQVVQSGLVEVEAPQDPAPSMPARLSDMLAVVRGLLASKDELLQAQEERDTLERVEREQPAPADTTRAHAARSLRETEVHDDE